MSHPPVEFDNASIINLRERDHLLQLHAPTWPRNVEGWNTSQDGYLWRTITDTSRRNLSCDLWEAILRFPSAPIHGLHRIHFYQYNLASSENFHTLRILANTRRPPRPPRRIYLLQNGLNEYDRFGLYYQLASQILARDEQAICLLRPFPGHLSRFPFQTYSDTPLDIYLSDGSLLFRQFMRYLIESRWLLSSLVPRSQYLTPAGCNLVAPTNNSEASRLTITVLVQAIHSEWRAQHRASTASFNQRLAETHYVALAPKPRAAITKTALSRTFSALRSVLNWSNYRTYDTSPPQKLEYPTFSVVGYSLGGFIAQSLFMAWPFVISSCSTLLAGGPLRELAPTAFAHPEEWQTVLHSLRYELDNAMMEGYFKYDGGRKKGNANIAGVEERLFLSLQRVFYEVFSQDYKGSYQTRLSEHGNRMLFVVGGDDPIVRPRNVIEGGPDEGVNMIEVARLKHFIAVPATDTREVEQRKFWIPQIAKLVAEFTMHAETVHLKELKQGWSSDLALIGDQTQRSPLTPLNPFASPSSTKHPTKLKVEEQFAIPSDGALTAHLFGRFMDDFLVRTQTQSSCLFILRNTIPTTIMPDERVLLYGQALHHQDSAIREYLENVRARRTLLERVIERTCLVFPETIQKIFLGQDPANGYPTQGETPLGAFPINLNIADHWQSIETGLRHLADRSTRSVRYFSAGDAQNKRALQYAPSPGEFLQDMMAAAAEAVRAEGSQQVFVTALPDCWISMNGTNLGDGTLTNAAACLYGISADYQKHRRTKDEASSKLYEAIATGRLRVVSVSRSRLNPRYMGRIIIERRRVAQIVMHAALCIAMSRCGVPPSDVIMSMSDS